MKWFPLDVFCLDIIVLIDEEKMTQVLLLCECIDDFLNLHKKLLYDHYNKTISFIKTDRGVI